jgi:hypothetical protein
VTESGWLDSLRRQVDEATARMESIAAGLQRDRVRVTGQLDRALEELGRVELARELTVATELHDRVFEAFRTGRFGELSRREQRFASKQFRHATPPQMQELLSVHPGSWSTFASECFRYFDDLTERPDFSGYARLLCLAPAAVKFLQLHGRPQDIVSRSGPAMVASQLTGTNLREARDSLQQMGFEAAWAFSAVALAKWASASVERGCTFGELWDAVRPDVVVEAMLLPRLRGTGAQRSWFTSEARPPRVRGAVEASAVFVSALLRAAHAKGAESTRWSSLVERLLDSTFGDPRIPPETPGWAKLRGFDDTSYRRFLEILISEDLEVFFKEAMDDARRKEFWSGYLKSVRRTVCVLDRTTHDELTKRLAGADKKLSAAISRARKFRTKGGMSSAQAFCLYFDSVVVVEFSRVGNAAQIYDRAQFEKHFERQIYENRVETHQDLKDAKLHRDRIVHTHTKWETATADALSKLGIYPDRRTAAR